MTPFQDTIALCVAASIAVLLIASAPAQTMHPTVELAQSNNSVPQRPSASVREVCQDDIARFCADARGPQGVKSCMQGNAKQLKPACHSALETAGLISK